MKVKFLKNQQTILIKFKSTRANATYEEFKFEDEKKKSFDSINNKFNVKINKNKQNLKELIISISDLVHE